MMAEQVDWFNANGGLDWCVGRTTESSGVLYDWAEASDVATPFVSDPALRSGVVATIDIDDSIDATGITKALRLNGDRRHRALPQARPQPAARGSVPRGRPR